jgi:hypothetical protein
MGLVTNTLLELLTVLLVVVPVKVMLMDVLIVNLLHIITASMAMTLLHLFMINYKKGILNNTKLVN